MNFEGLIGFHSNDYMFTELGKWSIEEYKF